MGSGAWCSMNFADKVVNRGFASTDALSNASTQSVFTRNSIKDTLNPYNVVRECRDSDEHPNTVPIILGIDTTGSMNHASKACIAKLNDTILSLYENFKDVEIAIAGIGDFNYDRSPFQLSQFESDTRIVDNLFDLYIENGGGGNSFESYSALWYAGLHHTNLDCWKRGKNGILISLGDETLNPYLPKSAISQVFGDTVQADIDTEELYDEAVEKFDIYHIAITDNSCYWRYADGIKNSFGPLLGQRLIIATSGELPEIINNIVKDSMSSVSSSVLISEDEISW